MAKPFQNSADNEQKEGIEIRKLSRQGMTEEGVHHMGAVSQFWCIASAILVRLEVE
jgi:hypothetical protein